LTAASPEALTERQLFVFMVNAHAIEGKMLTFIVLALSAAIIIVGTCFWAGSAIGDRAARFSQRR
jgi:hypothetical protein